MDSMSTRRVVRRMTPAKVTVVQGSRGGGDTPENNKENVVNCFGRSKSRVKGVSDPLSPAGNVKAPKVNVLQPRKRSHNHTERTPGPGTPRSRELSPPELTTSDTFKPAKRVVGPKQSSEEKEDGMKQLPKIKTLGAQSMTESCDVLVSSPKELGNLYTPDLHKNSEKIENLCTPDLQNEMDNLSTPDLQQHSIERDNLCTPDSQKHSKERDNLCTPDFQKHSKGMDNLVTPDLQKKQSRSLPRGSARDSASKAPGHGRRLSSVKLNIAREGKSLTVSSAKKHMSVDNQQISVLRMECSGKGMVFSAKKKSPIAEHLSKLEAEVEKARLRALERRSPATKRPVGKHGVGKFGGKPELLRKEASVVLQPPDSASRSIAESIRTRKLSTVLKSEQRLAEKNEQYGLQLRQLQDHIAEKDFEVERLTSAGLILNNLVSTQMEEIRELRFRLKETFIENAEVRDVCEKLDRELRLTSLKLARMQQTQVTSSEAKVASLTIQLQSMAIGMAELRMNETSIAEGLEDSEQQEVAERGTVNAGRSDGTKELQPFTGPEDFQKQEVAEQGTLNAGRRDGPKELPRMRSDEDKEYTLQDLQEMVLQEENLLKEECANALRELSLPLSPLLTSKGSLDVDSVKVALASISSSEDYQTTERISAIRRLSAWIGST